MTPEEVLAVPALRRLRVGHVSCECGWRRSASRWMRLGFGYSLSEAYRLWQRHQQEAHR